MKRTLLTTLGLLVLAVPALAADGGAVSPEEKRELGRLLAFSLWLAIGVLVALPTGVVLRATTTWPGRTAGAGRDRGAIVRLAGLVFVVAALALIHVLQAAGVVGVTLALILFLALVAAVLSGLAAAAARLGERLRGPGPGSFTLGWLVLAGLPLLPVAGVLYLFWWLAWGIGATLFALRGAAPAPNRGNPPRG